MAPRRSALADTMTDCGVQLTDDEDHETGTRRDDQQRRSHGARLTRKHEVRLTFRRMRLHASFDGGFALFEDDCARASPARTMAARATLASSGGDEGKVARQLLPTNDNRNAPAQPCDRVRTRAAISTSMWTRSSSELATTRRPLGGTAQPLRFERSSEVHRWSSQARG